MARMCVVSSGQQQAPSNSKGVAAVAVVALGAVLDLNQAGFGAAVVAVQLLLVRGHQRHISYQRVLLLHLHIAISSVRGGERREQREKEREQRYVVRLMGTYGIRDREIWPAGSASSSSSSFWRVLLVTEKANETALYCGFHTNWRFKQID